jgi:hypothetical protein
MSTDNSKAELDRSVAARRVDTLSRGLTAVRSGTAHRPSVRVLASTPQVQPRPGRWALIEVWNGAVLASFDSESAAREAMTGVDDDEVVVLYVRG